MGSDRERSDNTESHIGEFSRRFALKIVGVDDGGMDDPENDPMVAVPVYLPASLRRRLKTYAARNDTTVTAIARVAMDKALSELERKESA